MRRLCSVLLRPGRACGADRVHAVGWPGRLISVVRRYSGSGGGGRNCGFVSYEQCMETIRGMGGFCEQNLFYTGPAERPAKHARSKHHDD